MERVCKNCGMRKLVGEFWVTDKARGYLRATCKECDKATARRYYATHPEHKARVIARAVEWDRKNPDNMRRRNRRHDLKARFGLTEQQYADMLVSQGGCCALCGASDHGRTGKSGRHDGSRKWRAENWNVDHDHATGVVRGLLCQKCNVRVGAYERLRDEVGFEKLAIYLARSLGVSDVS